MIYGINYANRTYRIAQIFNTIFFKFRGRVDKVIEFKPTDLDIDFIQKNQQILSQERGGGYWLWKPYIIYKTLEKINWGDYILYCDSGALMINKAQIFVDIMSRDKIDLMVFEIQHPANRWTKRDAYHYMDCEYLLDDDMHQICGGFSIVKKTDFTLKFFKELLEYSQDPRLITDQPNTCEKGNHPNFIEHRHDQSIFNLLLRKNQIRPYIDPSLSYQERESFVWEQHDKSTYPRMFWLHRYRNLKGFIKYEIKKRIFCN